MNLTIKDLPLGLHRKLKARAHINHRSLNSALIDILEKAVESAPFEIEALLPYIGQLRSQIKGPLLTEEFLASAKNEGRA